MTNEAPEKIYVEIKHPFSEEYTQMIAFEDGNGIEYIRTDAFIDKAMKVICNGCAQKVECEFNNWKTCSTKDELIKSMKGE